MDLHHQSGAMCIIMLGKDTQLWSATEEGNPIPATIPVAKRNNQQTSHTSHYRSRPVEFSFIHFAILLSFTRFSLGGSGSRASTFRTSHTSCLLFPQGLMVIPSGCLPSAWLGPSCPSIEGKSRSQRLFYGVRDISSPAIWATKCSRSHGRQMCRPNGLIKLIS